MCLKVADVNNVLLVVLTFFISTSLFGQSVGKGLFFSNQKLSDILLELALVYNVDLVLNHEELYEDRLSIDLNGETLQGDLRKIFGNRNIKFQIRNGQLHLQPMFRVYGHVYDERSAESLINATIYNSESGKGVYTNEYGYFSLLIPYKSKVEVSYIGYESKVHTAKYKDGPQQVFLNSELELNEVIVVRSLQTELAERKGMQTSILDHNLKTVFATGGVSDVFQYLFKQSGVHTGADGLGGLHVRGGGSDQNLILYDGVELFNPSHSLGMFSVFNTEGVNSTQFYKSGLPVKYAGKASSVVDIRMKEGDLHDWSGSISTSTLATSIGVNGPIFNDKTGISIIARRTHIDPFFKNITSNNKLDFGDEGESNHFFYDINAKLHHVISREDRIYLSYFKSSDAYDDETLRYGEYDELFFDDKFNFNLDWGNEMGSLRWNHLVGTKAFSNLTLYKSQFNYSSYSVSDQYTEYLDIEQIEQFKYGYGFVSKIKEWGGRYDWDLFFNDKQRIKMGAGYSRRNYDPGIVTFENEELSNATEDFAEVVEDRGSFVDNTYYTNEWFVYLDQDWDVSQLVNVGIGARYTYFKGRNVLDEIDFKYHLMQGGLRLQYLLRPKIQVIFAYDYTRQPLHLITASDIGFPNDLWVPSTDLIKPILGNQLDLTFRWQLEDKWTANFSGYYKLQSNLIRYQDNVSLPTIADNISTFWESEVLIGKGRNYGINSDVTYGSDNLRIDMAYSYSLSQRRYGELENGEYFPYQFDQPHKFNLNSYYKLNSNLWLYANFTYNSGNAQTLYTTDQPFSPLDVYFDEGSFTSEGVNTERLKDYHRLDMGLRMSWGKGAINHDLTLGVQNVYNHANPYYSYLIQDSVFPEENGLNARNGLPILPTLSYRIGFN